MPNFSKESASVLSRIASMAMEKAHAPSASVTLLKEGEVVYSRAFGTKNLESNSSATSDTLYGIGSCTKSFICLSILQLTQRGLVHIYDPISDYVPVELGYSDSPITLHHLMTHSSGYPSLGIAHIMIDSISAGEGWIPLSSKFDFIDFINAAKDEVDGRPEERYYYLNAGYILLGFVIEQVSSLSLEEYLKKNIWRPLGMDRTTLLREKFINDNNIMTAYWKELDNSLKTTIHPFHELVYAPGGILSSTNELSKYLQMYLRKGQFDDNQIIEQDLLEEMFKPHIARQSNIFGENHYGYGWNIHKFQGYNLITHTGSTGVSSAFLGFMPELDIAVAYLSNIGYWSSAIPHSALALLMDKDPEQVVPYLKNQNHLQKLSGTYSSYRDIFKINLIQRGWLLYAEAKNKWMNSTAPLIPVSDNPEETEFYVYNRENGKMKVTVENEKLYWERWILHKK